MSVKNINREKLINENYGIVHACANRFKGKGIEYDDLYQNGCVGLIKAADGFDESRGFAFSTYAVPVILGEIKKLFRDGGAIKVSRSIREKNMKIQQVREQFVKKNMREPTVNELAQIMSMECEEVVQVLGASQVVLSLTPCDDENESSQLDIAVDYEDEMFDTISLHEVIDKLDENDRKLVVMRYFKGMTQSKTASYLGVSQVQVSRREKNILMKLRKYLSE